MHNYELIKKTFPFIIFYKTESDDFFEYKHSSLTFWYNKLTDCWDGNYYHFSENNSIKSFLIQLYKCVINIYGKL